MIVTPRIRYFFLINFCPEEIFQLEVSSSRHPAISQWPREKSRLPCPDLLNSICTATAESCALIGPDPSRYSALIGGALRSAKLHVMTTLWHDYAIKTKRDKHKRVSVNKIWNLNLGPVQRYTLLHSGPWSWQEVLPARWMIIINVSPLIYWNKQGQSLSYQPAVATN